MKCPYCSSENTKVVDKRASQEINRRRRECLECSKRFTTYEQVELPKMPDWIKKRDGGVVKFEKEKITDAIFKAFTAVGREDRKAAEKLTEDVVKELQRVCINKIPEVEQVQDIVERALIANEQADVAKAYILYREQHARIRKTKDVFLDVSQTINRYLERERWDVNENANEAYSFSGLLLYTAGEVIRNYALNEIYTPAIRGAYEKGYIHIHDLVNGFIGYCAGWSLKNMLLWGFGGVPNKVDAKPAKHMDVVVHQMINYIGCLQMEFAGAQAFNSVDTLLAPFVRTDKLNYKQVKQAMQTLVFSLNIPSRWGCVTPDTEILTQEGWKTYYELKEGEEIWSLDIEKQKIVKDNIKKLNIYNFDGELIKLSNRSQEQLLTPNHRVIRVKYNSKELIDTKAEDLLVFDSPVYFPVSREINNKDVDIPDDKLKLYAWIVSGGSIDEGERVGRERITLHQSPIVNRGYCDEIESLLNNQNIPYGMSFADTGFADTGFGNGVLRYRLSRSVSKQLVKKIEKRQLPMNILRRCSARQIRLFITEYIKGDGSKERMRIFTKDEQIKNDFQELCALCGYGSCVHLNKNNIFVINIHKNQNQSLMKKEKVKYSGKVWCPTTNTSTWIARRRGNVFITGNSQYPFSNLTFDWTVPEDMKDERAIVGGEEQDFTYGECQKEMDMINKAFIEVMMEGDALGRIFTFPIPTYNITKDFDFGSENAKLLFEMTAKYGTPYFQNYVGSGMDSSSIRAMCCRLNINLRELTKRPGHIFAAGDNTGSIGVVTINVNRLAYESKTKEEFFERLRQYMYLSKDSLEMKREVIQRNLDNGLMPYAKRYLGHWNNHFSTIGICGMNEACLNLLGKSIKSKQGKELAIETLTFMSEILKDIQEETGHLYNLEATPAEGTSYRFGLLDKQAYPDIITAGKNVPYLTNSTHLAVDETNDLIEALEHQNDIQHLYTGGTIFHIFLGERLPSGEACKNLVKKIAYTTRVPYFTITPTFSICKDHGYITGEKHNCPECGAECEVFSRVVGYFRPIRQWNLGKQEEFRQRATYN